MAVTAAPFNFPQLVRQTQVPIGGVSRIPAANKIAAGTTYGNVYPDGRTELVGTLATPNDKVIGSPLIGE